MPPTIYCRPVQCSVAVSLMQSSTVQHSTYETPTPSSLSLSSDRVRHLRSRSHMATPARTKRSEPCITTHTYPGTWMTPRQNKKIYKKTGSVIITVQAVRTYLTQKRGSCQAAQPNTGDETGRERRLCVACPSSRGVRCWQSGLSVRAWESSYIMMTWKGFPARLRGRLRKVRCAVLCAVLCCAVLCCAVLGCGL
jgi:hypothetical protein